MKVAIGPDAARYLYAAQGKPVPRPFHLRVVMPWLCGTEIKAWWVAWSVSWVVLGGAMFGWAVTEGLGWRQAAAAVVLLTALPGILGPPVVIPVGVDLPATALGVASVALLGWGHPGAVVAAVILVCIAGGVKESTPLFAAVWAWNPLLLAGLAVPAVLAVVRKPGPDPLGPEFQRISDHPVRAALEHHAGKWRNGWLMVAPWGVCLAALVQPSPQVCVALAAAYGVLLVATDTVRLVQHAAGPVLALAAAERVPVDWLLLACVLHVAWWWNVERV